MRKFIATIFMAALLLPATAADAASLPDKPHSVGMSVGTATMWFDAGPWGSIAATSFAMEIPYEFHIKVGPGELALHAGLFLTAGIGGAGIGIPIGARYKIKVLKSHPLYVGPLMDIGPYFAVGGGSSNTAGLFRVGATVNYMVHPSVEVYLQPTTIGAFFGGANGNTWSAFAYTFQGGVAYRF